MSKGKNEFTYNTERYLRDITSLSNVPKPLPSVYLAEIFLKCIISSPLTSIECIYLFIYFSILYKFSKRVFIVTTNIDVSLLEINSKFQSFL